MPVDRETLIEAIRSLAQANGGVPPGRNRFERATGHARHDWYGRYWSSWGEALKEAGFAPKNFTKATDREELLQAYLSIVVDKGKIPSEGEFRTLCNNTDGLPSYSTFASRLGTKRERLSHLLEYCRHTQASQAVLVLIDAGIRNAKPPSDEKEAIPVEATTEGFVYLLKSGKSYKIGKTNSLDRRQYEIGLQLPEQYEPVHAIKTDDPSGIEAYWHNRFKDRRLNGEWFRLSAADVRVFRRRKFM